MARARPRRPLAGKRAREPRTARDAVAQLLVSRRRRLEIANEHELVVLGFAVELAALLRGRARVRRRGGHGVDRVDEGRLIIRDAERLCCGRGLGDLSFDQRGAGAARDTHVHEST